MKRRTFLGIATSIPLACNIRHLAAQWTAAERQADVLIVGGSTGGCAAAFAAARAGLWVIIALHPSAGCNNYMDVSSLPFQIPL